VSRSHHWLFACAAGAAVACAAGSTVTAASAAGSGGKQLFVSHTGVAGAPDTSCATAAYSSVQTALGAAGNGGDVYLCGTAPFIESVVVQNNGVLLTGDPGAAIQAPLNAAAPTTFFSSQGLQTPQAVVTVLSSAAVQVNGLIIEGPFVNAGCGGDDFGVLQVGTGLLQLNNDQVLNVQATDQINLAGCQYGVGIQIGRRYWPNSTGSAFNIVNFTGHAQLNGVGVSGYQKNGITADGPGTRIQVSNTTVDGGGQTAQIARNGIQIGRGATGSVDTSSINNNEYTGPGTFASATAILIFGGCGDPLSTNIQVRANTMQNNDTGVSAGNFNPACTSTATSPTNIEINNNTISKSDGETNHSPFTDQYNNAYTGYQVGISDTGDNDQVHNNTITGTPGTTPGTDTAYGPQTTPGGPFLAPIDIQTYPPAAAHVHDNTYDGSPTYPPY
jgi:hypothetical protein